jgi:hypothetical protein
LHQPEHKGSENDARYKNEQNTCQMFKSQNKKVKCTLVQALRLCTGRTAYTGSRGMCPPLHNHGTRRGQRVSVMLRPLFTSGKDPVPIVQEAGWTPGPVWTGAENLAPTGIRSSDRPARSQLLYQLYYSPPKSHSALNKPTHSICHITNYVIITSQTNRQSQMP